PAFSLQLSLSNAEIPAEEIMKFALIRNLRELEIANDPKVRFLDFSTSILPLLRMKGHQLESLTLSHFPDICVQAIGTCCPNLRKFSVTHVDAFACSSVANDNSPENEAMISSGVVAINGSSSDAAAENTADEGHNGDEISEPANGIESTPSHPMFGKLEDFEMICQFYGIVPRAEHLLTCLVKAEDLKRMTFKACTSADDRFFSKLLRVNPLKKLQKISLDFCPVTTKTVLKFLRMENDLHFMTVCDTGGIDLKSYRDITIEANSMNLDLYIEWNNVNRDTDRNSDVNGTSTHQRPRRTLNPTSKAVPSAANNDAHQPHHTHASQSAAAAARGTSTTVGSSVPVNKQSPLRIASASLTMTGVKPGTFSRIFQQFFLDSLAMLCLLFLAASCLFITSFTIMDHFSSGDQVTWVGWTFLVLACVTGSTGILLICVVNAPSNMTCLNMEDHSKSRAHHRRRSQLSQQMSPASRGADQKRQSHVHHHHQQHHQHQFRRHRSSHRDPGSVPSGHNNVASETGNRKNSDGVAAAGGSSSRGRTSRGPESKDAVHAIHFAEAFRRVRVSQILKKGESWFVSASGKSTKTTMRTGSSFR
ncbi:unnamed protein product, partial [Notodromas monacha]